MDTSAFIDNTGYDDDGNVKRKMFDAYYSTYDCEWAGRKWDTTKVKGLDDYVAQYPESLAAAPTV